MQDRNVMIRQQLFKALKKCGYSYIDAYKVVSLYMVAYGELCMLKSENLIHINDISNIVYKSIEVTLGSEVGGFIRMLLNRNFFGVVKKYFLNGDYDALLQVGEMNTFKLAGMCNG